MAQPLPSLNEELTRLLTEHGAAFVVTAYLQQGALTLDVSENLQRAGIVFQVGIVGQDADTERTVQPTVE